MSPFLLLEELDIHNEKLLKLTGYTHSELEQIKSLVISQIEFVAPQKIHKNNWKRSYEFLQDIDENDVAFLALTFELNGTLWTGDKKLMNGLKRKNYHQVIATDILYAKYFEV